MRGGDRPLVTIITPTLNQGPFIEHALRSVARQTYQPIEHIVVDGGSADGTLDILRREAGARLRWISEPDRGMYDAVNKGLAMATGEVLAYLNSDDALLPWAVEAAMAAFDRWPEADLAFGDGVRIDQDTRVQRLRLFPPFDRASLAQFESLMQPAVFWRRRLVERIGPFDGTLRYVADLDYWLRAVDAGATPIHVDEVLAVERVHAGALTEAHRDAMADEDRRMRSRHGPDPASPDGRAALRRAIRRHKLWRRRLWVRFLAAHVRRGGGTAWARFLRDGRVRVSVGRALAAQLPRAGDLFLPNAVVSELAAEVLDLR